MPGLVLGIELGSTRIKSVLTDGRGRLLASGSSVWENRLLDGWWTYPLDEVRKGVRESFRALTRAFGGPIKRLGAVGVSAMMHGYLAFDGECALPI